MFVGYQVQGSLGRNIKNNSPSENKSGGYYIDGKRITIKANAYTIIVYSAHADQIGLTNFVKRIRIKPKHIFIVHGDEQAKT